jgi:hypothetical protein
MMLTRTKLAVVLFAALATVACNGKPTPPPSNNSNAPSNSNGGGVRATAVPTDSVPFTGIAYQPTPGTKFTKGFVIVEGNMAAGTSLPFRIIIKRSDGADVTKNFTLTGDKNVLTIPLAAADLGKVTEINWKESEVDPNKWTFKRYKMVEYKQISANAYAAEAQVTDLGEIDCPQAITERGIFTTPIGLRVYLQQ